jgi:hypothetical protein
MTSLIELKEKYNIDTDKQSESTALGNFHNYLGVYEEIFKDVKDEDISILEIGVWKGESLKLWSKYFTKGKIYGIDIFERDSKEKVEKNISQFERINLYKVNSYKEDKNSIENRNQFFKSIGDLKFDIIIDDGEHSFESQIKTFAKFKHLLSDSGIYIIEDIRDWCSEHGWLKCPHNPPKLEMNDRGEITHIRLINTKEKPWNDYSKCSDTHLQLVKKAIPELKIIDLNPPEGGNVPDNIIGYYQKQI